MRRITLCADDFAQSEAISQGILDLVARQRISAVSCMTNAPLWLQHATALRNYHNKIDIGLHFTLTHGCALTTISQLAPDKKLPSLKKLLSKSYLRRLSQCDLEQELHSQIDQFEKGIGYLPDFIDGHEHVHQFPIVRDALLAVYEQRLRKNNSYIRVSTNGLAGCVNDSVAKTKSLIITVLGASQLRRVLVGKRIPYNLSFSGIYNFDVPSSYAELFSNFLAMSKDQGLIMCHPAYWVKNNGDAIGKNRWLEYQYFSGQEFSDVCQKQNVEIVRLLKR